VCSSGTRTGLGDRSSVVRLGHVSEDALGLLPALNGKPQTLQLFAECREWYLSSVNTFAGN
jgi:hypothetical protein